MKIIDVHTHVGDTLFGRPMVPYEPDEWYSEIPLWAYSYELNDFDVTKMQETLSPENMRYFDGMLALGDRGMRIIEVVFNQEKTRAATLDNLLRSMKKNRVDYSVLLPIEPYTPTDKNLELCKKTAKLLTFASVHPKDPDKFEKIRRYMRAGCRGLKLHPVIQGVHPSDPSVVELMEEYKKYNRPVIFHTGESSYYLWQSEERRALARLGNFEEVISKFPGINFILGHLGQRESDAAIAIVEKYRNAYVDCTLQPVEVVKGALERIGADRMLYGSDFPYALQDVHIRIINKAFGDNYAQKEKVFHKNAERLIGSVG